LLASSFYKKIVLSDNLIDFMLFKDKLKSNGGIIT